MDGTINAYLAMRAAFVAVLDHNRTGSSPIGSIAAPGLGTGVGGMDADESAAQMRAAYDIILGGRWRSIEHPAQAPFVLRAVQRRVAIISSNSMTDRPSD